MANPSRRGQVGAPVSTQMQGDGYTNFSDTSFILPYGLKLQQKVGMVDITNATASGGTVTYTAANNYSAGNVVSIYGINPVAYNLQNATIASASPTQFTITNAATGTYVSGGIAQRTGEISVIIPAGITFVYAVVVGGGGSGGFSSGGGGGLSWGWTLKSPSCVIGAPVNGNGNYSRYGNVIAGGGGGGGNNGFLGGGGGSNGSGGTNYYGIPNGIGGVAASQEGKSGSGGGGGFTHSTVGLTASAGGDGISGGGGGSCVASGSGTNTGGNGGNGIVGGGGGAAYGNTGIRASGNGGTGINILTGLVTLGGTGTAFTNLGGNAGGGGGVVGNGTNATATTVANGGLGGGGGGGSPSGTALGGAGIVYLFY